MLFNRKGLRVFVYQELIDMRFGFERLHSFCVNAMQARMDQGHLYVFFGKNRRRLKILWFDGTGLTLASKRMETGSFMSLEHLLGKMEITQHEFELILHGSTIKEPVLERAGFESKKLSVTQRESVALLSGRVKNSFHVNGSRGKTSKRTTPGDLSRST